MSPNPDHLGSATFLTDHEGLPYQFFLNLPFGESMAEQRSYNGSFDNRWKFTGKELDEETGLYYFGARFYNPSTSIWLSVDPLVEKYPNISPYVYVANNPVLYVDPDGREIVIIGTDGTRISYTPDMNYRGEDKFVSSVISQLNNINTVKQGQKLLNFVVSSNQIITITNEKLIKAVGLVPDNSAGTLKLGNLDENFCINILSHEIFHGYQQMNGQGGTSIHNEVEAYLFGDLIENLFYNYGVNRLSSLFESGSDIDWFDLTRDFTEKPFDIKAFNIMVNEFKSKSGANSSGLYDDFPLKRDNQTKNLYEEFHPINNND